MSGDPQAAAFSLSVKGAPISDALKERVQEIVVRRHLERASTFMIRFSDPASELVDADTFAFGKAVDIKLGWVGAVTSVLEGEITAQLVTYTRNGSYFVVRGMDKGHRLRRGARHRSLAAVKDGAAAQEVTDAAGLTPDAKDTSAEHSAFLQLGISDHALLSARAERLGYRLQTEGDTVAFQPPTYVSSDIKAEWEVNIEGLDLVMEMSTIPTEVEVRGWDPIKKEAFSEVVTADDLRWAGSDTPAPTHSEDLFGVGRTILQDLGPRDAAEATSIGAGWLQARSEEFIRGPVTIPGNPDVKVGTLISLVKIGDTFSGSYLVRGFTHFYTRRGFRTRLELARTCV